jgi:hypothetical protein
MSHLGLQLQTRHFYNLQEGIGTSSRIRCTCAFQSSYNGAVLLISGQFKKNGDLQGRRYDVFIIYW